MTRRSFLRLAGASLAGLALRRDLLLAGASPAPATAALPTRLLGKTGARVTIFGLGGQGLLDPQPWQNLPRNREAAVAFVNRALDLGVNLCDTAAAYGDSELYLGEVMKTRRKEVFLVTKHPIGSKAQAQRGLARSLRHLQTDHVDLLLLHHVGDWDSREQIVFALENEEGCLAAFRKAREEKTVRFLGFSTHDPLIANLCLEHFDFDAALLPVNAADRHYRSFLELTVPKLRERSVGIIGMKAFGLGALLEPGEITASHLLRYAFSQPVHSVIVGCRSQAELEENVGIARAFKPMTAQEQAALEDKTRDFVFVNSMKKNALREWGRQWQERYSR